MNIKSDNPADPFKKALAEATKVMANDPELSVTYTVDPAGLSGESMFIGFFEDCLSPHSSPFWA